MQMLFESSFSFCTQQVTTRLQTADGSSHSEAGGGAVEAQVGQQQQPIFFPLKRVFFSAAAEQ
jgi:hypothetical protein